jgi:hypothetical protein
MKNKKNCRVIVDDKEMQLEKCTEIEVSNINPLTGKPWNEPFYMCDLQESEVNQKNNNQ